MIYNGQGQRLIKSASTAGAAVQNEYYFYDEQGRVIGEYNHDGTLDNEMVYHAGLPILALRSSGVWMIQSVQLGTPRALVGASGAVAWSWDSAAFGDTYQNSDPDGNGVHLYFDHRFPRQLYDSETRIHDNYFRTYDPSTGRYTQSDPIRLAGGLNTYGYVNQNPLKYVGPLGLQFMNAYYDIDGGFFPGPQAPRELHQVVKPALEKCDEIIKNCKTVCVFEFVVGQTISRSVEEVIKMVLKKHASMIISPAKAAYTIYSTFRCFEKYD